MKTGLGKIIFQPRKEKKEKEKRNSQTFTEIYF